MEKQALHKIRQAIAGIVIPSAILLQPLAFAKEPIATFPHKNGVFSMAFSPDGNQILTGTKNKAILWDKKGNKLQIFPHNNYVISVAFSPDGKHILTGDEHKAAFGVNKEKNYRSFLIVVLFFR
ncbi:MAG: hypothetical protein CSA09_04785 [Candidatus Contendobacter odensis]|uniref:Anaphase-promoting complex subunit 4 WD40 domain-containing protein n=1 Tax=Candidatus Contendibacter odensensis TaxID=1400860 RepID=A0A2G6PEA0_9GAMM|nr:MAG: hypothetical protein CSA09_04785 [Candidatus Contendobacter odensis]